MIITSVERNKKNKGRLSVYIDGVYSFSISEEDYLSLNLYEKKEITQGEIDYIKENVSFREAKSVAVKYLSLKLRPEKEVREKLHSEGYDCATVNKVIEELKSMGYINDRIYTQKYVFDRIKLKPKAKRMLKYELQNKGVSEDIIEEVLADCEIDELDVAESLVKRKFGKYDLNDGKIKKKVFNFLLHRGYSYEVANSIINKNSF